MSRVPALRSARILVAVSYLVAALAPCGGALAREAAAHPLHTAHASAAGPGESHGAHPCPEHGEGAAPTWLDELCPCGCDTGAPPGSSSGRVGPALLPSAAAPAPASQPPRALAPEPGYRGPVPLPPDTVPRSA